MDDETFGDVYKKRLDAPDFVVEDSKESTGYADNGMDDYDREYSSEDGKCLGALILRTALLVSSESILRSRSSISSRVD